MLILCLAHSGAHGMLVFCFVLFSFPSVCQSHSLGRQSTAVSTDVASEVGRWGLLSFTRSPPRDLQKFIFLTKTSCTPTLSLLGSCLCGAPWGHSLRASSRGWGDEHQSFLFPVSLRGSCCPEHGRWLHKQCSDLLPLVTLFPWFLLARSLIQIPPSYLARGREVPLVEGPADLVGF